ncbi:hypothetical protein DFH05DRAFT_1523261 [Lentinula detonsa]|uniref:Uncharacterized protein n=1 Tax=Lentinula detonsa TaxID=2804962 RepID=A0A9W8P4K7_9AGAR|nr:hypothetical protein DFH05DRAFT_1523261 [Lentinula detonsa]
MSTDMLQSNESIYVISLPHRADRRIRMESLRKYLGLNWTFIDATYADEEIVATIMSNVYKLREEAMRARLELQRIRDEKLKEKEKEDDSDLFALADYPDDLELHSTSTSHLPLSTPISSPYQSSQSNRKFTGVKLPFQWPVTSSFTNQSVLLESPQELSIFASSISHPSLKTRILEFFNTFDIYANHSDGTHRTWRTESDIPNLVDDNNDHEYFSHFLTNLEADSSPKSSISKTNDFDRSSLTQLELICATKDFSLSPYLSTLPYHKYLTSARVAVWHSHLKVLRQIVQEEDLRRKNEQEPVESPGEGKEIASTTLANARERRTVDEQLDSKNIIDFYQGTSPHSQSGEKQIISESSMTKSQPDQPPENLGRDKHHEHISIILEDDINVEKDIRYRLRRIWDVLPDDWDIVFLGHCWSNESFWQAITFPQHNDLDSSKVECSYEGVCNTLHPSHSPRCTHAYATSPPGARKLLAHLEYPPFAYSRAIDQAYAWLVLTGRLKAYSVVGSVVVQVKGGGTDSTTGNGGQDEANGGRQGVRVGDVWRPSWRKNHETDSEAEVDRDHEVSTSSWSEELFDGVFLVMIPAAQLMAASASPIGSILTSSHEPRGLKHFSSNSDLKTKPDKFVGFHYAPQAEAEEYNKVGTLTTATVIEQNPYVVVYAKRTTFSDNYWECQVHVPDNDVETVAINEVSKLFVPNNAVQPWPNQDKLEEYVKNKGSESEKALLFHQATANAVELLIPPRYLKKSQNHLLEEIPSGENDLHFKVTCHARGVQSGSELKADWPAMWSIRQWPESLVI